MLESADQPLWLTFIVAFILMNVLLVGMAYMTWFERKVIAAFQDRLGPTRSGPHGLLQPLADGIKLLGKEDLAHRNRLQWFLGHVTQHVRRVEPNLRPLGRCERCAARRPVEAENVVEWRLEIRVAETFNHDAVDTRHYAIDRMRAVDANDSADADRRVQCRPEVELVRRIRFSFRGNDPAERGLCPVCVSRWSVP